MKDKKAAKTIIRLAKEHPDWYTDSDVKYAKIVRRRIKREEKLNEQREISDCNSQGRGDDGIRGEGEQPSKPRQSQGSWFIKVLHKARALVRF